jgi:hypothetical protein
MPEINPTRLTTFTSNGGPDATRSRSLLARCSARAARTDLLLIGIPELSMNDHTTHWSAGLPRGGATADGFAGRFSGQTVNSDRSKLDHIRRRQR